MPQKYYQFLEHAQPQGGESLSREEAVEHFREISERNMRGREQLLKKDFSRWMDETDDPVKVEQRAIGLIDRYQDKKTLPGDKRLIRAQLLTYGEHVKVRGRKPFQLERQAERQTRAAGFIGKAHDLHKQYTPEGFAAWLKESGNEKRFQSNVMGDEGRDMLAVRLRNTRFISAVTGVPERDVDADYDRHLLNAAARLRFKPDEAEFDKAAGAYLSRITTEMDAAERFEEKAAAHAMAGDAGSRDAFTNALDELRSQPGYSKEKEARYFNLWSQKHRETSALFKKHQKPAAEMVWLMDFYLNRIEDEGTATDRGDMADYEKRRDAWINSMLALKEDEWPKVFAVAAARARASKTGSQEKGLGQRMGENLSRGVDDVLGSALGGFMRIYDKLGGTDKGRRWNRLRHEFNRLAREEIDPARYAGEHGWFSSGALANGLIDAAYSIPMMASAATGWGGLAVTANYYRDDSEQRLIDAGVSGRDASLAAVPLGMLMGALDRVQLNVATGKLPVLGNYLKQVTTKGLAGKVAKKGAFIGVALTTETAVEKVQDNVLPDVAQNIIAALDKDVPGVSWKEHFEGYNWKETIHAMLPLAILAGLGDSARSYYSEGQIAAMMKEAAGLKKMGLPADMVDAIVAEQSTDKKLKLLQKTWKARAKGEGFTDAEAPEAAYDPGIEAERYKAMLDAGQIPEVISRGEGYEVIYPDGRSLKTDTREAAFEEAGRWIDENVAPADSGGMHGTKHDKAALEMEKSRIAYVEQYGAAVTENEDGTATVRYGEKTNLPDDHFDSVDDAMLAVDAHNEDTYAGYLNELRIGAENIEAMQLQAKNQTKAHEGAKVKLDQDIQSLSEFVAESKANLDQAIERVQILIDHGQLQSATGKATVADLERVRILGQVRLREKARGYIARISKQGNIATVIEEGSEGWLRDAIRAGAIDADLVKQELIDYQSFSGDKFTKATTPAELSDQEMIEGFSRLAQAHMFNKGQEGAVQGRLGELLRTLTEFFRAVIKAAESLVKLKQEGLLSENLEGWLDAAVGLDTDQQVESMTKEEVGKIAEDAGVALDENGDPTFSIGRATVSPDASTQHFQTKDGGLIGPGTFSIEAYHGTPHKVDRFSTDNIGTGEGAQAYGWGLYFAEDVVVADFYRKSLSEKLTIEGIPFDNTVDNVSASDPSSVAKNYLTRHTGDADSALSDLRARIGKGSSIPNILQEVIGIIEDWKERGVIGWNTGGNTYTVTLKAEEGQLLDWDKPLAEQSENFRKSFRYMERKLSQMIQDRRADMDGDFEPLEQKRGSGWYGNLVEHLGSPIEASRYLHDLGIKGIRFLDGNSRGDGEGSYNYVIFDDKDITITHENGQAVDLAPSFSITRIDSDPVVERVRALMRDPDTRLQIYGKMQKTLTEARRMVETEVYTPYGKQKRDAIVQPRSMTSLRREAADMRRKAIEDETNAIYETLGDILDDETLTSLKEQPVTSRITEEGGIESYTEATKRHGDDLLLGGEYDDLAGLPPLYWGGSTTPDIMAEMLHTQGLINEPTVTAMAEAIDGELATVSRNKEHLGKARARLKAVREKAGADSRAWLTDRLKEQQRDHNPRTVTLRSIASLEAVVRVLPAEVRGKVGGFRHIAKLSKPDAIANELLKRIETADRLLERHLQQDYRTRINKILKQSGNTVDKATRRKRGKIGALSHEVAEQANAAKVLDGDQSQEAIDKLREEMADIDLDDAEAFFELDGKIRAVELFYDFMNADSARLAEAHEFIAGNYKAGREEVLEEMKKRKAWRQAQVEEILSHIPEHEGGRRAAVNKSSKDEKKWVKRANEFLIQWTGSQHHHLARVFENSTDKEQAREVFNKIIDSRLHAEAQSELEREGVQDRFFSYIGQMLGKTKLEGHWVRKFLHDAKKEVADPGITSLEGRSVETVTVPKETVESILNGDVAGLDGEMFSKRDLLELEKAWERFGDKDEAAQNRAKVVKFQRIKSTGNRESLGPMSQTNALNLWLTLRQADQSEKLEAMGFDETTMDELEAFLDDKIKAAGLWMVDHLEAEGKAISNIHAEEYFVKLPTVRDYFPVNNIIAGKEHEMDPGEQKHVGRNMSPGAMKTRVANMAEPNLDVDAFTVFFGHVAEMTWWKQNVKWVREWGGVFRDARFAEAVKTGVGDAAYKNLTRYMDALQNRGMADGAKMLGFEKLLKSLNKRYALGVLGMRMSTIFVNASAFMNTFGSNEISTRRLLKNMVKMAFDPKGELKATWNNEIQKMRREFGSSFEAAIAMASDSNQHWIFQDMDSLAQKGLLPMNYADVATNTITMAAIYRAKYDDSVEAGMDEETAREEAQKAVSRAAAMLAQPTLLSSRSTAEMNTMHNPFLGLVTMFRSEIRKNFANNYFAWRALLTGKGIVDRKTAARQAALWTVVYPAVVTGFREILNIMSRDEDDDEFWKRVTSFEYWTYGMMADSLRAIPILGDAAAGGIGRLLGQPTFGQRTPIETIFMKAPKVMDAWGGEKTAGERVDGMIDSAQASVIIPGGVLLAQTANVAEWGKSTFAKESETPIMGQNPVKSFTRSRLLNHAKEIHKDLYDTKAETTEEKKQRWDDLAASYESIKDAHPELWPEISAKLEKQGKLPKEVRKRLR